MRKQAGKLKTEVSKLLHNSQGAISSLGHKPITPEHPITCCHYCNMWFQTWLLRRNHRMLNEDNKNLMDVFTSLRTTQQASWDQTVIWCQTDRGEDASKCEQAATGTSEDNPCSNWITYFGSKFCPSGLQTSNTPPQRSRIVCVRGLTFTEMLWGKPAATRTNVRTASAWWGFWEVQPLDSGNSALVIGF